jgi:predicted nucleotidyltransferase
MKPNLCAVNDCGRCQSQLSEYLGREVSLQKTNQIKHRYFDIAEDEGGN